MNQNSPDKEMIKLDARLGISLNVLPEELEILKKEDKTAQNLLIRLIQSDRCVMCGDTYFPDCWNEEYLTDELNFDLPINPLFVPEKGRPSLADQIQSASKCVIDSHDNVQTKEPQREPEF